MAGRITSDELVRQPGAGSLRERLALIDSRSPERASRLVRAVLEWAVQRGASDVHFEPTHRTVEVRARIDGVLHQAAELPSELAPNVIARLKVLAELLTYRIDIPQEGRIGNAPAEFGVDMRVSTFPTVHGEKAVVRLFDLSARAMDLEQLGLRPELQAELVRLLGVRSGAILLTGPSGSGKTTTIYACLRHLVRSSRGGQQIVSIEDPVEQVIEGVTQAQARPGTEFDFARGLRSLLRQDPEVIMIGEIRDSDTAGIAIEASLTGHLVISTLHAGSACGVVGRLLDMGVEPYVLTSGLVAIQNQRLVRRVCPRCGGVRAASVSARQEAERSDGPGPCGDCAGTGYRGRLLLAELLVLDDALRRVILGRPDTATLERAANERARTTIAAEAARAVAAGETTSEEIARVIGPL